MESQAKCWAKGRSKEGQGARQKRSSKKVEKKSDESAAVAVEEELFTFTCTSDFNDVAESLQVPKLKHDAVVDSGASSHFCPDWLKFATF